ncbi:hypothetical protein MP228_003192 [Amoeboaphelidium protococcarum]|nr:hypothetical protein MP228_003192 [Amoeboaphelidium protococcarum]
MRVFTKLLQITSRIVIPDEPTAYYQTVQCFRLSLVWLIGAFLVLAPVFTLKIDPAQGESGIKRLNTIQSMFPYLVNTDYGQNFDTPMFNTVVFIGWLLGATALSWISDRAGRLYALRLSFAFTLLTIVGQCAVGVVLLFYLNAHNVDESSSLNGRGMYYVLLTFRLLMGAGIGGNGVISYVWGVEWATFSSQMITEYIDTQRKQSLRPLSDAEIAQSPSSMISLLSSNAKRRPLVAVQQQTESSYEESVNMDQDVIDIGDGSLEEVQPQKQLGSANASVLLQFQWSIGCLILPLVAFLVPNWVLLNLLTLLVFVMYYLLNIWSPFDNHVHESPKWLLSQTRTRPSRSEDSRRFNLMLKECVDLTQSYNQSIAQEVLLG